MRGQRRLGPVLLITLVLAATGCTTTAAPSARVTSASASPRAASPTDPPWAAGAPDAMLLVGRAAEPDVRAIVASTGQSLLRVPLGVPARPDWGRAVVATASGADTKILDLAVGNGDGSPEVTIDGAWRLPTIGYDPMPVGLSADGSTVVLVENTKAASDPARAISRFAVVGVVPLAGDAQIIELPGAYEFDALSPNGRVLYVVEHLGSEAGRYQVRAVDLPGGTMRAAIIADKRNLDEAMAGWPIAQLRAPTGIVYTLYRGLEHPFIHMLNTVDAWAVCIDLPANGVDDQEAALDWGLAAAADWRYVYAANASLGLVAEVDPAEYRVRRTATVDPGVAAVARPNADLAKFGHEASGPVARRTLISPDGNTAYVAGPDGIFAIGTSDLKVKTRLLDGSAVDALGLTPDGHTVFALLHEGGRIVAIDGATGRLIGWVPGKGFDRLLAVMPW